MRIETEFSPAGKGRILRRFFALPVWTSAAQAADRMVDSGEAQQWWRMAWAMRCAVGWTGLEVLRGWFLSGFPWNFLGASQFRMLPLIQIASVTGILGVSFLVAWTSVSLGLLAVEAVAAAARRGSELLLCPAAWACDWAGNQFGRRRDFHC